NKLGPLGLAAVMAAMSATERLAPTAAVTISAAAPHGPLHPGAKIAADASLHGLWLCVASFSRHCIVRRFFAAAQFNGFSCSFRVRFTHFLGNTVRVRFVVIRSFAYTMVLFRLIGIVMGLSAALFGGFLGRAVLIFTVVFQSGRPGCVGFFRVAFGLFLLRFSDLFRQRGRFLFRQFCVMRFRRLAESGSSFAWHQRRGIAPLFRSFPIEEFLGLLLRLHFSRH